MSTSVASLIGALVMSGVATALALLSVYKILPDGFPNLPILWVLYGLSGIALAKTIGRSAWISGLVVNVIALVSFCVYARTDAFWIIGLVMLLVGMGPYLYGCGHAAKPKPE